VSLLTIGILRRLPVARRGAADGWPTWSPDSSFLNWPRDGMVTGIDAETGKGEDWYGFDSRALVLRAPLSLEIELDGAGR
jgi:hypothetical protein